MTSLIIETRMTSYKAIYLGDDIFSKLERMESNLTYYTTLQSDLQGTMLECN